MAWRMTGGVQQADRIGEPLATADQLQDAKRLQRCDGLLDIGKQEGGLDLRTLGGVPVRPMDEVASAGKAGR
jgi:hypothetical protein